MSRSNYVDLEPLELFQYRGAVGASIKSKRGQKLIRDLIAALDAMPEKKLIGGSFTGEEGEFCALGAVGNYRKIDLSKVDKRYPQRCNALLDCASSLALEVMYENDEGSVNWGILSDEGRWCYMRRWAVDNLLPKHG